MRVVTVVSNAVLLGFTCLVLVTEGRPRRTSYIVFTFIRYVCWAFADQYPYPEEDGLIASTVFLRNGVSNGWLSVRMDKKVL